MTVDVHIEPDGTADSLKTSLPEDKWNALVKDWDSWLIAFTKARWADEEKFYFYQKDKNEALCIETYPSSSSLTFRIIIPGIGEHAHICRGTIEMKPESFLLTVLAGEGGQLPAHYQDTLPMSCVAGWMVTEGSAASQISIFMKTSKGIFNVVLVSALAHRIAQCLQAFSRQYHDSQKTPSEERPTVLESLPDTYIDRFPLSCCYITSATKAEYLSKYGTYLVHGDPTETPKVPSIIWSPKND